jgi:hypothetical protein
MGCEMNKDIGSGCPDAPSQLSPHQSVLIKFVLSAPLPSPSALSDLTALLHPAHLLAHAQLHPGDIHIP